MQRPTHEFQNSPVRVLVVEDHELMRENLCRYLELRGYTVASLSSVQTARAAMVASPFDVVFVDLQLPDGDGLELLRQRDGRRAGVVITMSGFDSPILASESLKAGALAHLSKPFSPQEIEAVLAKIPRTAHLDSVGIAQAS